MATTVTGTKPLPTTGFGGGSKPRGPNGNGSHKRNGHDAFAPAVFRQAAIASACGWRMAAILMMFTALTSAYIVRAGSSNDWQPLAMPRVLLLSTALIIVSSVTIEAARRKLKGERQLLRTSIWLAATVILGSRVSCCRSCSPGGSLCSQGIYVSSNPHSSFFYLLTATHGVHLLGGLIALLFLVAAHARSASDNELASRSRQQAARGRGNALLAFYGCACGFICSCCLFYLALARTVDVDSSDKLTDYKSVLIWR